MLSQAKIKCLPPGMLLFALTAACLLGASGCSQGKGAEPSARPDLITMDGLVSFGPLERPAVQFPHDLHTAALAKQNQDCSVCHPAREDGRPSPLFMRLKEMSRAELEELYHTNCIDCHSKTALEGKASGPETCGQCHRRDPVYTSSRLPFGFDKSLHYRHIEANENKCENCHHVYDEDSKKLVYKKDTESSCRDCHRSRTEENRISLRQAAHQACIGCHYELRRQQPVPAAGPVDCAGCHDRDRQLAIKVIDNPPRLERNQPDFVLLSAAEADLASSKLNTVPFPHSAHEGFTANCRVCHHETLSACKECHTLAGSDKSDGVTLQEAMHEPESSHSCIGCHQGQEAKPACAGCHGLMEQGLLSEHACNICHAGPSPDILASVRSKYNSLDDFRPSAADVALSFTADEIPDSVTIGILSKEYPAVEMPHKKIVDALAKHIDSSKVARYFHGREDVLCEGCHHHGSIGREPALCANCHGQPFDERNLFKPGLYGAYHRSCLGCHESMQMEELAKCITCHPNKIQTARANH
jgi:mono/diheme cytochrome c family protein